MQQYQNVLQDKFGNVIVGASVAVYVYGTTTPATIYSGNGTGLLPSNTVTTSSLGEFAFYAANGRYSLSITATNFVAESYSDFILYDPADIGAVAASGVAFTPFSTIAATNVQNAIQEVVSDLAGASGSSLVGFLQSGTGAVARTVQAKERDVVSVKDFGATGDGTTDDTAAFITALTERNGKPLLIPAGQTFKVSTLGNTTLTIPVNIYGGGTLDGGSSATSGFVFGTGITSIRCQDITFQNFSAPVMKATAITNTIDEVTFVDNTISSCQKGVYLVCIVKSVICDSNRVTNISHSLDTAAFHFGTNTYSDQDQRTKFVVTNNIIDTVASTTGGEEAHGIIVYGREAVIANNVVKNVSNPTGANSEPIYTKVRFGLVANNVVTECTASYANNSAFICIKGSVRSSTAQTQGYGMTVSGNSLYSSSGANAAIRIECDDCSVIGNYIEGFGGVGIYSSSGTFLNITVSDNTIRNTRGSIAILTQHWGRGLSIIGNRIYGLLANQAATTNVYGIRISNFGGTLTDVAIRENVVVDDGTSAATSGILGISIRAGATYTIASLDVSNNFVSIAHASIVEYGVDVTASGTVSGLVVKNNNLAGVPISSGYPIITSGTITGTIVLNGNLGWGPIYSLGSSTLALYHSGNLLTDTGSSSTFVQTLPVSAPGVQFSFLRTTANAYRIDPNGSEVIRGGGAGKYLELASAGASVSLICVTAGTWEILASFGTLTYEP